MLKAMYLEFGRDLRKMGTTIGKTYGLSGYYRNAKGIQLAALPSLTGTFEAWLREVDYPLDHRKAMEHFHYEKLFNTLVHALGENYYYLHEHPKTSRRIVATSTDCISVIQCKGVNQGVMALNVFMRSSHYHNLLPVDLLFLFGLVPRYIGAAKKLEKTFKPNWDTFLDDVEYMDFNISFGSLHTGVHLMQEMDY